MKRQNKTTTTTRLGGYLTAAVSCGTLASTASAAIVTIDISAFDGPNANVANNNFQSVNLLPGNGMYFSNNYYGLTGVAATWSGPMNLAMKADGSGLFQFGSSGIIDSTANWNSDNDTDTYFKRGAAEQPAWGANSYIGFQANSTTTPLYGWLEVTWNPTTDTFEFLSGAYESTGAAILAGGGAVPEPSTAVLSLGALAAGAFIRRRKQVA